MFSARNTSIVLYCRTGDRSSLAAAVLKEKCREHAVFLKARGEDGYPICNRHGEFTMAAFEKR
jgi:rhodanese-related sulfurtransferase